MDCQRVMTGAVRNTAVIMVEAVDDNGCTVDDFSLAGGTMTHLYSDYVRNRHERLEISYDYQYER